MSSANISPGVHIGEVVRNAVLFKPGNHHKRSMNPDSLIETVARFFTLLRDREIEYVLVGGIALGVTNSGFSGDGAEIVKQALDSTGGFNLVLAGAKAFLEHNINLNLIADRFPDGH